MASELASRLRTLDGVAIAVVLIVGYVYVQALRGLVAGLIMPPFSRDIDAVLGQDLVVSPRVTNGGHFFSLGDRVFFYGDVLEWGLTLGLLLITLVLVGRRLGAARTAG